MLRSFTQNLRFITNPSSSMVSRTIFSEAALGIDKFKLEQEKIKKDGGKEMIVKRFEQALNDKKVLSRDLQNMLVVVETEDELDLFVKTLKEYYPQPAPGERSFSFSAPLMRLFYTMNKTDLALETILNEENKRFFTVTGALVLGTKLFNEGRYKDVLRLFDLALERRKNIPKRADNLQNDSVPEDVISLAFAALNKLGDQNALSKTKDYCNNLKEENSRLPIRSVVYAVLLALKHNDTNFANEIFSRFRSLNSAVTNLKLLTLARSNLNDAVDLLDRSRTAQSSTGRKVVVHRSTLNDLKEHLANNTDLLNRFDVIVKDLQATGRVNEENFEDRHWQQVNQTERQRRLAQNLLQDNRRDGLFNRQDQSNIRQFDRRPFGETFNRREQSLNRGFEGQQQLQSQRFGVNQQFNRQNDGNFQNRGRFDQGAQSVDRPPQSRPFFRPPSLTRPPIRKTEAEE